MVPVAAGGGVASLGDRDLPRPRSLAGGRRVLCGGQLIATRDMMGSERGGWLVLVGLLSRLLVVIVRTNECWLSLIPFPGKRKPRACSDKLGPIRARGPGGGSWTIRSNALRTPVLCSLGAALSARGQVAKSTNIHSTPTPPDGYLDDAAYPARAGTYPRRTPAAVLIALAAPLAVDD